MTLRPNLLAAMAAAAGAAVLALLLSRLGFVALAAVVLGVGALWFAEHPRPALGLLLVLVVAAEVGPWLVPGLQRVYDTIGPLHSSPVDLVLYLAVGAVVLQAVRDRELAMPVGFGVALGLLAAALVSGYITGRSGGGEAPFNAARATIGLLLVPLLVVNVVRDRRDVHRIMAAIVLIVGVKALAGLGALATGSGSQQLDSTTQLTFYEAVPNFLCVIVLLGATAAAMSRTRMPAWVLPVLPIVFACLLLSFRRSWWIAAVAGGLLVVIVASGAVGRRLLVPAVIVVAAAVAVLLNAGIGLGGTDSAVGKRITSLSPSRLRANPEDRYRLDERRNVLAELRQRPISGLGFGVKWRARFPLSVEHASGRGYVHFAALWWWLNMGILGLLAYFALAASAILLGLRVWRREHGRGFVAVLGLTGATAWIGLCVAETTATFQGADQRTDYVLGGLAGLLAAAARLPRADVPSP